MSVKDINESIKFYSTVFGQAPTKVKEDYAKWMLDDPRINFAISNRSQNQGIDHLGIQVDDANDLMAIKERLKNADLGVYGEGVTTCCYAESDKAWVKDPAGIAWEAYHTMGEAEIFNKKEKTASACCAPKMNSSKSCC